jgi:uncharacterized membrane protein
MPREWIVVWTVWNLFLAALPVVLAGPLARRIATAGGRAFHLGSLALGVAWLLLLPNAPYLLTEVRHFVLDDEWRDLTARAAREPAALRLAAGAGLLFVLYGAVGLVAFVAAVRPVERALRARFPRLRGGRIALLFVVSLGVWLGLIPRYNSWDALVAPVDVVGSAVWAVTHPPTLACLLVFAGLLGVFASIAGAAWDALPWSQARRAVAALTRRA